MSLFVEVYWDWKWIIQCEPDWTVHVVTQSWDIFISASSKALGEMNADFLLYIFNINGRSEHYPQFVIFTLPVSALALHMSLCSYQLLKIIFAAWKIKLDIKVTVALRMSRFGKEQKCQA